MASAVTCPPAGPWLVQTLMPACAGVRAGDEHSSAQDGDAASDGRGEIARAHLMGVFPLAPVARCRREPLGSRWRTARWKVGAVVPRVQAGNVLERRDSLPSSRRRQ